MNVLHGLWYKKNIAFAENSIELGIDNKRVCSVKLKNLAKLMIGNVSMIFTLGFFVFVKFKNVSFFTCNTWTIPDKSISKRACFREGAPVT